MAKVGRKGKYEQWLTDDGLLLISGWKRDGLTDLQVAKKMGISESTFHEWKRNFEQFSQAVKKGKEIVDFEVENALLRKCLGYYVEDQTAYKCKDVYYDQEGRKCINERVEVAQVRKYVAPDTTAQLAWLNNRKSENWKRNAGKERLDEKKFEHEKDMDNKRNW